MGQAKMGGQSGLGQNGSLKLRCAGMGAFEWAGIRFNDPEPSVHGRFEVARSTHHLKLNINSFSII